MRLFPTCVPWKGLRGCLCPGISVFFPTKLTLKVQQLLSKSGPWVASSAQVNGGVGGDMHVGRGGPQGQGSAHPSSPCPSMRCPLCVHEASVWKESQFLLRHLNSTECSNLFEKCKISPVLPRAAAPQGTARAHQAGAAASFPMAGCPPAFQPAENWLHFFFSTHPHTSFPPLSCVPESQKSLSFSSRSLQQV